MKRILQFAFLYLPLFAMAQAEQKTQNVFIITIDGLRWQELFNGANKTLVNDADLCADTANTKTAYWDEDATVRRQKLMPFLWNVIATRGQIYGNRNAGSRMDVTNKYHFSYPGYSEIFTGFADSRFVPNTPVLNKNTNVLEFINKQQPYAGRVVAISSWNVFPYILNEPRCGFEVNSGYEPLENCNENACFAACNQAQDSIKEKGHTRLDALTYCAAKEYIVQKHPRLVALGFGETDEFAHRQRYDQYLTATTKADQMIADLWSYVQNDPFYKDNTTFIITTDHGRGRRAGTWDKHLFFIPGSKEVWMAVLGPSIKPLGEMKDVATLHHNQIAATVAGWLGYNFTCEHEVGEMLPIPMDVQAERGNVLARRVW